MMSIIIKYVKNNDDNPSRIDINNDNGIKFENNNNKENEVRMKKSKYTKDINNNIKMNDLRWSKLNHGVNHRWSKLNHGFKLYREVTRSNNKLKVLRIYDG